MMTVQAGTNCPQGGDSGHGGRTVFRIFDDGATDLRVRVNEEQEQQVRSIEIILGGDCEADCFAEALEFAARTIRGQFGLGHLGDSTPKEEEVE
jgi:hypothetical protein